MNTTHFLSKRWLEAKQQGLWLIGVCVLSMLPLYAQNVTAPERLVLFDLSGKALTRTQSQAIIAALAKICNEENNFAVVPETVLAAYLDNRRHFSVLFADSVRVLCANLSVNYLIVVKFENASSVDSLSAPAWRITMRWLDGGTGQMTKTLVREHQGNVDAPESLPLREMFLALLESPEVILPVDNLLAEMPDFSTREVSTPVGDDAARNDPAATPNSYQNRRGRHWLWYFTGAAVLGGGSTLLLLRKSPGNTPAGKTLLPEPPDPPK